MLCVLCFAVCVDCVVRVCVLGFFFVCLVCVRVLRVVMYVSWCVCSVVCVCVCFFFVVVCCVWCSMGGGACYVRCAALCVGCGV